MSISPTVMRKSLKFVGMYYRPYRDHGLRRHIDESTSEKLQCLYDNLTTNKFRRAAVVKKILIVN